MTVAPFAVNCSDEVSGKGEAAKGRGASSAVTTGAEAKEAWNWSGVADAERAVRLDSSWPAGAAVETKSRGDEVVIPSEAGVGARLVRSLADAGSESVGAGGW